MAELDASAGGSGVSEGIHKPSSQTSLTVWMLDFIRFNSNATGMRLLL